MENIDVNSKFIENRISYSRHFHIAAKKANAKIAQFLLKNKNIDINSKYIKKCENIEEKTALHIAIIENNIEFIRILLKKLEIDANISLNGKTPLLITIEMNREEIIEALLNSHQYQDVTSSFMNFSIFFFNFLYFRHQFFDLIKVSFPESLKTINESCFFLLKPNKFNK